MSQNNSLFNETWNTLANALDQVLQFGSMSPEPYMALYNTVGKYFRSSEYSGNVLKALVNRSKPTNESNNNDNQVDTNQVEKNIFGGELYFNLKKFFKDYLEKIAANENNLQGEDFLKFYAKTWEKYQSTSQIANGILDMLNSGWVTRQQRDGVEGIYDIYTMAMKIWQDMFFKEPNQSITQTCLKLINDERNGRCIDSSLIRYVVGSYVSTNFTKSEKDNTDSRTLSQSIVTYVDYFEKQFLEETEQFYKLESNYYITNYSTNDYIKKVIQRLQEEERRVKDCLHPITLEKLNSLLDRVLIIDHLELIYIEAQQLSRDEKIEDFRMIFILVNRVNAHELIQNDLENYVYQVGISAIDRRWEIAIKDPKVYVETIIEIYQKFSKIVNESFCGEQGYKDALDKAFRKFVNNNAITQAAGKSTKSSELVARYCDAVLRERNRVEESDVGDKIDQIMVVFNYLEDKSFFQKVFGLMLAIRLIYQLSVSEDYEEIMSSKLKAACGFEYVLHFQRMLQDIRLSTNLMDQYKTYCETRQVTNTVYFSVMVLTSNSWPFTAPATFNLPIELKQMFASFTNFYSIKFTGRKLKMLSQHSRGDLQTLYTERKYTLHVSTYQMTILLLFNEFESITIEKMLDTTQIESELFKKALFSLLKSKVLTCSQINANELNEDFNKNTVKLEYTIQVNENFKSGKMKINLNQSIKSIQEEIELLNDTTEDPKILIQAVIVRIMKAEKTLKTASLIKKVITELTSRFKPKIPMIKECIEILIKKEYLKRDEKEIDLLHYLP